MAKKWWTDLAMVVFLLLLMAYSLVGEVLHEWMGIGLLALFILHHIWNRFWYQGLGRGKLSPYRMVQTALNFLLFAAMAGMILSGLILSQHVLDFLPLRGGETIARAIHLPSAYWGFLMMSLHLGLHWGSVMGAVRRRLGLGRAGRGRMALVRTLAACVGVCGLYAFSHNRVADVLLLRTHFLFFPPGLTAARFLTEHLAIMGLFAGLAHYGGIGLRRLSTRKKVQP